MSHLSGIHYLLAATSTYWQPPVPIHRIQQHRSGWYKSSEKIRRFMMAGCNQQVVEDIIRSFQCVSVCLLLTAHSQQTHSPLPRDFFLLLCTIPQMSCYRSFLSPSTRDGVCCTSLLLLSAYSISSFRSVFYLNLC
jgi:hypothetical protein